MPTSILTVEDLLEFKVELLGELRQLFDEKLDPVRPKTWLRSTEVMELLKISHATLQNLRNNKTIPCYKVEGLIYYDRDEIDTFVMEGRVGQETTAP